MKILILKISGMNKFQWFQFHKLLESEMAELSTNSTFIARTFWFSGIMRLFYSSSGKLVYDASRLTSTCLVTFSSLVAE